MEFKRERERATRAAAEAKPEEQKGRKKKTDRLSALHDLHGNSNVAALAEAGMSGPATSLPYLARIQHSFGRFDVSTTQAFTGDSARVANEAMDSLAYTAGNRVAFKEESPDLFTVAHESAHLVHQQLGGPSAGIGATDSAFEVHADEVATAVVQGASAEPLLANMPGQTSAGAVAGAIQRRTAGSSKKRNGKKNKKGNDAASHREFGSEKFGSPQGALDRFVGFERLTELFQLVRVFNFPTRFFSGMSAASAGLNKSPVDKLAVAEGCANMRYALDIFLSGSRADAKVLTARTGMVMKRLLPSIRAWEASGTAGTRTVVALEPMMDHLTDMLAVDKSRSAKHKALKAELSGHIKSASFVSFVRGTFTPLKDKKFREMLANKQYRPYAAALEGMFGKTGTVRLLYREEATTAYLSMVGQIGARSTTQLAKITIAAGTRTKAQRRATFQGLLSAWQGSQGHLPCGRVSATFQGKQFNRHLSVTALWAKAQRYIRESPNLQRAIFIAAVASWGISALGTAVTSAVLSYTGLGLSALAGATGVTIAGVNIYSRYNLGTLQYDWRGTAIDLMSVVAGVAGVGAAVGAAADDVGAFLIQRFIVSGKPVSAMMTGALKHVGALSNGAQGAANFTAMTLGPGMLMLAAPDVVQHLQCFLVHLEL